MLYMPTGEIRDSDAIRVRFRVSGLSLYGFEPNFV